MTYDKWYTFFDQVASTATTIEEKIDKVREFPARNGYQLALRSRRVPPPERLAYEQYIQLKKGFCKARSKDPYRKITDVKPLDRKYLYACLRYMARIVEQNRCQALTSSDKWIRTFAELVIKEADIEEAHRAYRKLKPKKRATYEASKKDRV